MPNFKYTAITSQGEDSGTIKADSLQAAIVKLKEQNMKVTSINQVTGASFLSSEFLNQDVEMFTKKVKTKDLAVFCKQLHTMLTSGMPITRCMEVLAEQSEHPKLKVVSKEVSLDIRKGNLFSDALKKHPKVFPDLLVNMVEAGELTGNLDSVIDSMAKHFENETSINSKINLALMYPKFLGGMALVIVIGMLVFVVPKFLEMFTKSGQEVPALTQVLINMSNFVTNRYVILIIGVIVIVVGFKQLMRNEKARYHYQLNILKIPKLGVVLKKLISTRFARTMSTLLQSGIPIVYALEASAKVTGNVVIAKKMEVVVDEIRKGNSLSYFLREMDVFPPILISMVSIGEESGDLDGMFSKVADYFDSELDENIKKIISIIEPAMIVIMGIVMGFIIVAMYLPILGSVDTIQGM